GRAGGSAGGSIRVQHHAGRHGAHPRGGLGRRVGSPRAGGAGVLPRARVWRGGDCGGVCGRAGKRAWQVHGGRTMTHGGNVWQGEGPGAWLDYSANIRPEGMPEWVRQALRRGMESAAYYPEAGMERATRAMAAYLGISPECVLPTAGGI